MPPRLIHYHIFKNAGTSVDEALHRSFGDGFMPFERALRDAESTMAAGPDPGTDHDTAAPIQDEAAPRAERR